MFLKNIKKLFLSFLLTLLVFPQMVLAYSDYVIAGGENIGIEIKCDGALIVGTYKVDNNYPALEAGLTVGDIITSINNEKISSAEELIASLSNISSSSIKIGYMRDNVLHTTNLKLYKKQDGIKTGIYVKDSISGVGTLTFIDPNTKLFGALGHEIIEKNSGTILEVDSGSIFSSYVTGINPSSNGSPGEKNARYNPNELYGTVKENTNKGIFGNYITKINSNNLFKVGNSNDIKKGRAHIRTVIENDNVEEFEINIDNITTGEDIKNISFTITDSKLLNKTGGIIQGMSGSPIIQNDMIVGAVTHMVVETPKKGYGIFITNMLMEAEN